MIQDGKQCFQGKDSKERLTLEHLETHLLPLIHLRAEVLKKSMRTIGCRVRLG